jgi:hypothetical protein
MAAESALYRQPSRFAWLVCGGVTTHVGATGEVFIWDVGTAGRWVAAGLYVAAFVSSLWLDAAARRKARE